MTDAATVRLITRLRRHASKLTETQAVLRNDLQRAADALEALTAFHEVPPLESDQYEYSYGHTSDRGHWVAERCYQSLRAFIAAGYSFRGARRKVSPWEPVNRQGAPSGVQLRSK